MDSSLAGRQGSGRIGSLRTHLCLPLYRDGDTVFIQNSLIFLDELSQAFDIENPWLSIGPRNVVNEDGVRISEMVDRHR